MREPRERTEENTPPFPTKTRLALAEAIEAGEVWRSRFFPYDDYLIEPGGPDRKVSSRCAELERAGLIAATGEATKRSGTAIVLTDAGKAWRDEAGAP